MEGIGFTYCYHIAARSSTQVFLFAVGRDMGHADIQMTANIYGHLDMQRKELLTQKMASSLF